MIHNSQAEMVFFDALDYFCSLFCDGLDENGLSPSQKSAKEKFQDKCCEYWGHLFCLSSDLVKIVDDTVEICGIATEKFNAVGLLSICNNYDDKSDYHEYANKRVLRMFVNSFICFVKKIISAKSVKLYDDNDVLQNIVDVNIIKKATDNISEYVSTTRANKIFEILLDCPECIVVSGNSSSGKTVAVAQAVHELYGFANNVIWFEMTNVNASIYNIAFSILKQLKAGTKIYFVFDNSQARPAEIADYLYITKTLCDMFSVKYSIILICWPNAENLLLGISEEILNCRIQQFSCNANEQIIELINAKQYAHFKNDVLTESRGDLLVANSILEYIDGHEGKYPSRTQLAESIFNRCTKGKILDAESEKSLYFIASLGEFEIHVKERFIHFISDSGLNNLIENSIVRIYHDENGEGFVYIGHRSMANRIANYLHSKYSNQNWIEDPEIVAVKYLRTNGQMQIHTMLERLDTEVRNSNNLFANLWKAFSKVREYLYKKLSRDCEWGCNMASMIFSAEALTEINQFDDRAEEYWNRQAIEIRSRWRAREDCSGLEYIGVDTCIVNGVKYNSTSEIVDFTENISSTMEKEEERIEYSKDEFAKNTDFNRFHDSWLLGLLLGFEGSANDQTSINNKKQYIECANKMQLVSGAFYPERVSWVTARVILGLAHCGKNYYNCETTKLACDWLIDQFKDQIDTEGLEFSCGGWTSGTGTWNSDIQITLMNLVALSNANYPVQSHAKIRQTINYVIINAKRLAEKLPNPLDIVWIVNVLAAEKQNLVELNSIINRLSNETLNIWSDADKTSFEKQKESSDVSFMAKELLNIMWHIVKDNIKSLLVGLEQEEFGHSNKKQIFISYRRIEGGGSFLAEHIYAKLNSVYKNNVFYDVKDLRKICSLFDEIIEKAIFNCKAVIVLVTDHAFDRCVEPDYDIEQDVFINEIKRAIKYKKHIIAVYNHDPSVPEKLKANPECYELAQWLKSSNAVVHRAGYNAIEAMNEDIIAKLNEILLKNY